MLKEGGIVPKDNSVAAAHPIFVGFTGHRTADRRCYSQTQIFLGGSTERSGAARFHVANVPRAESPHIHDVAASECEVHG